MSFVSAWRTQKVPDNPASVPGICARLIGVAGKENRLVPAPSCRRPSVIDSSWRCQAAKPSGQLIVESLNLTDFVS